MFERWRLYLDREKVSSSDAQQREEKFKAWESEPTLMLSSSLIEQWHQTPVSSLTLKIILRDSVFQGMRAWVLFINKLNLGYLLIYKKKAFVT